MHDYSPTVLQMLDVLGAEETTASAQNDFEFLGTFTLDLVNDPGRPAEEALKALHAATPAGRAMVRRLMYHNPSTPQVGPDGEAYLNGRACCYKMAERLNDKLERVEIPSVHRCPECHSTWRLSHRAVRRGR